MMDKLTRRRFLKSAALLSAGAVAAGRTPAWSQPVGSNDAVRLAVIGLGRKGTNHHEHVRQLPGVRLAALCDVDPVVLAREVAIAGTEPGSVFATTDPRRVLERDDVDAVIIATPDHWHALLTIWACQAGKDVYIEKPLSQTVWEGRQMVKAARAHGRVVQHGTQARSDQSNHEALEYIRAGSLGEIKWIHALFYKERRDIGRRLPWYPEWLDYDLFCGPAPLEPLVRRDLHYDWHWFWNTGNGDATNIGVHVFDLARLMGGHDKAPRRLVSLGGRFVIDDSAETPNSILSVFDYGNIPVIHEIRGLPKGPGIDAMDHQAGLRSGVVVHCEDGYFAGRKGGWVFDNQGKRIKGFPGDGGQNHLANFVAAVRSRRTDQLAASIETGHASSAPVILSTISYRIGRPASPDEIRSALGGIDPALEVFSSFEKHLETHGVDLESERLTLGRWLQTDDALDRISEVSGENEYDLERARYLFRGIHRPGFALPDSV